MEFQHIVVPQAGRRIDLAGDLSLDVPDHPIIPFIEGAPHSRSEASEHPGFCQRCDSPHG